VAYWPLNGRRVRLLVLLISVGVGGALRLRCLEHQPFEADQIRDCFTVRNLVINHEPVLVGPSAAPFPDLGPVYYYIIAPSMLFSQEPEAICAWIAILNTISIILCYKLGCELFGEQVGLLSALLYAVSPTNVTFSKLIWNPSILPPFTAALFYSAAKVLKGVSKYVIAVIPLAAVTAQIHPSGGAFTLVLLALFLLYMPKISVRELLAAITLSSPLIASAIFAAASTTHSQRPFTGHVIIPVDKAVLKAIIDVASGYPCSFRIHQIDTLIYVARGVHLALFTAGMLYVTYVSVRKGRKAEFPYMLSFLWFIIPYLLLNYSYVGTMKYHALGVGCHHVLWITPLPSILVSLTLLKLFNVKRKQRHAAVLAIVALVFTGQLLQCAFHPICYWRSIADVRKLALSVANATEEDFYIERYYPEEEWYSRGIEYFFEIYGIKQDPSSSHRYTIVDLGLYRRKQIPMNYSEFGGILVIKARIGDVLLCEAPPLHCENVSPANSGHTATLRDYPSLFRANSHYNLTIIFGSQVDASIARKLASNYDSPPPMYPASRFVSSGTVDWSKLPESNIISIGGPSSNPLTKELIDSILTPFYFVTVDGTWRLHSSLSGRDYLPIEHKTDYALIVLSYQRGRWFLIACGYGPNGTEAACMVIGHPGMFRRVLRGTAVLIAWTDVDENGLVDLGDRVVLIECYEQRLRRLNTTCQLSARV